MLLKRNLLERSATYIIELSNHSNNVIRQKVPISFNHAIASLVLHTSGYSTPFVNWRRLSILNPTKVDSLFLHANQFITHLINWSIDHQSTNNQSINESIIDQSINQRSCFQTVVPIDKSVRDVLFSSVFKRTCTLVVWREPDNNTFDPRAQVNLLLFPGDNGNDRWYSI